MQSLYFPYSSQSAKMTKCID